MDIRAVTFDVGGTLIKPWPSVGHVYAEVAARHGVRNISAQILETRFQAAWRAGKGVNDTRASWEALVDVIFDGLASIPPSRSFFGELYDRFARPEAWRIFDDVKPALQTLSERGLKLGVLSNWDERLRDLLRRLQLDTYFDAIIVSCEAGASKPDAAIFTRAASALGEKAEAILHVGDSLEMDLHGAESAGFRAARIHRGPGRAPPGALASLSKLPTLIGINRAKKDKV